MKTVCIESPLAGDFHRNIMYAKVCMMHCLQNGMSPFASHLLYTQVLDDRTLPFREQGIVAGLYMGDRCDERWFFTDFGFSPGMNRAKQRAQVIGQTCKEFSFGPSWASIYNLAMPTPGF